MKGPAKKHEQIGDAPIEGQHHRMMNSLATILDEAFNGDNKGDARKVGFILMTFNFGADEGRCNYISNANRKDVIVMLKEQIARFEGQPDMRGSA